MRGIRCLLRAEADGSARAANGYPRCERLSGGLTHVGSGRHLDTCPCTIATAPRARGRLATRRDADVIRLRDGTFVYEVQEGKPATVGALTAVETARIETIGDEER